MKKTIYSSKHKLLVEKLKKIRLDLSLTQKQVADKLNMTQSHLSKIENGDIRIDIVQLKILADFYKKDLSFFIR